MSREEAKIALMGMSGLDSKTVEGIMVIFDRVVFPRISDMERKIESLSKPSIFNVVTPQN
jgi:hypothetical protein